MLKNRFYVGEVAYRGEVHKGEHPAIVDREVFDRVQAMLSERTVARRLKRGNSPHLLTGLIFDDRGNPMSPTHANKKGVRYRYYTSHALLQRRKEHAGSVPRVSAAEVEAVVCEALRRETSVEEIISDKDLIAQHVGKVVIWHERIEVEIQSHLNGGEQGSVRKLTIPVAPSAFSQKGVVREPTNNGQIDAVAREKLIKSIVRATKWLETIRSGEATSFDEVAGAENIGERHLRRLAPLAFLSPKIFGAILDGSAPVCLTISRLTESLPHCWVAQEKIFGIA